MKLKELIDKVTLSTHVRVINETTYVCDVCEWVTFIKCEVYPILIPYFDYVVNTVLVQDNTLYIYIAKENLK